MLSVASEKQIEQLLLSQQIIKADQLDELRARSASQGEPLLSVIQQAGLIDDETLAKISAQAAGVPYVNLAEVMVPPELLATLPKELAETYRAVVFGKVQGRIAVALVDPTNVQAVDFLANKIAQPITTFMASQTAIEHVLLQYSAEIAADIKQAIQTTAEKPTPVDLKRMQNLVQDAPITRALNTILEYAANARASDIHIEPRETDLRIRFRIDGVLQEAMKLPKSIEPALISRIKILSNLKIDEHRIPQDGQFVVRVGKQEIDLRIAISPVVWGEQVVIRLLNKDNSLLTLEKLGFHGRAFRAIIEGVHRPHGMTLATGPTGSGKSTTLYALLQAIKSVQINIVTLEDPVEYKMEGINQIQVNPEVGLTFASGLRSILRQDPNVIMVGEIRDQETANLAVQSALTGHVVLTSIHTNSAAGVLPRLLDMQVEPFLVASTVNTVVGQRLVRKICDNCRKERPATPAEIESINHTLETLLPKDGEDPKKKADDLGYPFLPAASQTAYTLYEGQGCKKCKEGYRGRVGIYEVFAMSEGMEQVLGKRATTAEVQAQALADGMVTMKQDGYLKALNGETTLTEVARVASDA
jgi:type IV pilus assembly protein PilB